MKDRAMGFIEIAVARDALQLAPGLAAGMPIGADVATSEPAVIGRNPDRDRSAAGCRQCVGVLG